MPKHRYFYIFVLIASVCFAIIACASPSTGLHEGTAIAVSFPDNRAVYVSADVESYSVTIKSKSYTNTKNGKPGDTIIFEDIPVGTYTIEAFAKKFDDGIVAKNSEPITVTIMPDVISEVPVKLKLLNHWNVSFIKNDGTLTTSSFQDIIEGEYAKMPSNPSRSGYTFLGWSTTNASPYNYITAETLASTPVTADTYYYAIWQ